MLGKIWFEGFPTLLVHYLRDEHTNVQHLPSKRMGRASILRYLVSCLVYEGMSTIAQIHIDEYMDSHLRS